MSKSSQANVTRGASAPPGLHNLESLTEPNLASPDRESILTHGALLRHGVLRDPYIRSTGVSLLGSPDLSTYRS